jgi:UDP-N-acetylmuramate dehydrogenase
VFKDPEIKGRYIVTHVVFELSRTPLPKLEYGHLADAVASAASISGDHASDHATKLTPALIRKVIIKVRKEKLPEPSVMGSAGSFFKNPVVGKEEFQKIVSVAKAELGGDYEVPHYDLEDGKVKVPAAWMIEQCGFKGKRSGGAAVYDKQPLVIVNYTGEAYPEEILGMEKRIVSSVKSKFGIELQPEVEHI